MKLLAIAATALALCACGRSASDPHDPVVDPARFAATVTHPYSPLQHRDVGQVSARGVQGSNEIQELLSVTR
jgi:hypothetical protein